MLSLSKHEGATEFLMLSLSKHEGRGTWRFASSFDKLRMRRFGTSQYTRTFGGKACTSFESGFIWTGR